MTKVRDAIEAVAFLYETHVKKVVKYPHLKKLSLSDVIFTFDFLFYFKMDRSSCSKIDDYFFRAALNLSQSQWLKNRWESWIKSVICNHINCAKAAVKFLALMNNLINCGCISNMALQEYQR